MAHTLDGVSLLLFGNVLPKMKALFCKEEVLVGLDTPSFLLSGPWEVSGVFPLHSPNPLEGSLEFLEEKPEETWGLL